MSYIRYNESKLLITGGNWRLWKACKKIFPLAQYPSRQELDVTDNASVENYFKNNEIELVIHLVALASIEKCENDKKLAWKINVTGTRNILEASQAYGVNKFIYLQSACIFSGDDASMYDEDSLPAPKHYYGLTKLIAEEIVKTSNTEDFQTIIVRTNFTTMPWEYSRAFTDRWGTYLFAQWVAKWIKDILISSVTLPIIHICWEREISMYDYAIMGNSKVEPMTLNDYEWPVLTRRMSLTSKCWETYKIEDSNYSD